ncbi:helix-turn-helix domain-containing protein [Saccharothrix sp. ST-888]|uniref:helix-turn-helix domain-containing protein n=1 Tax=Saccharothrix sp. ST-888 TaxID=1427391 RepID=UPI000698D632|nr:helix-turn-helix domain-containing protein [Saccharothrix sp. ST-888]
MNQALRNAMVAATMTEAQLAEACGVDPKTVGRWLANSGRIPHGRHRWAASQALNVEEAVLWPTAVRLTVKTGADREIVQIYPYRSAAPAALWRQLIGKAEQELMFAGYTN